MKRIAILITLAIVTLVPTAVYAQQFEITPFIGYRFGDDFRDYYTGTRFDLKDSESYGFTFDYSIDFDTQFEFLWGHQETNINVTGVGTPTGRFPLDVDYFHIGGIQLFDTGDTRPFMVGTLGATHINPEENGYSSDTRFSFGLGGGVKFFPTDHIGVRLDGRVYATYVGGSGGVFCGPYGCTYGYAGNTFWQVEFTAGIIFGGGK